MIGQIISGGQAGVDRAALDAALELGIPVGGYCPKGRLAEDGPIDPKYPLTELDTSNYPARTRRNVSAAHATLILVTTLDDVTGGTLLTQNVCIEEYRRHRKHFLVVLMGVEGARELATDFIRRALPSGGVLDVAGPRESKCPGIYDQARAFLLDVLPGLANTTKYREDRP